MLRSATHRTLLALPLLVAAAAAAAGALPGDAHAQTPQVTVTMEANVQTVPVGGTFSLTVAARAEDGRVSNLELPGLDPFSVVSRSISSPTSVRFVNGQLSTSSASIYQLMLRAERPGRFVLSPAKATVDGKVYESRPLTILVRGSAAAPNAGAGSSGQAAGATIPPVGSPAAGVDGAVFDEHAFIRTTTEPKHPYVGQQVTVRFFLYSHRPIRAQPELLEEPTTDGFWVQDLFANVNPPPPQLEVVQGRRFYVYEAKRVAAFPLQPGDLTIGPMRLRLAEDPFAGFFGGGGPGVVRAGVPVTVHVRPLPDGVPKDAFVGSLSLHASVDHRAVHVGDAVQLSVNASGTGNLTAVRPTLGPVDGARVLQPEMRDALDTPGMQLGGVRTIEWLVIPTRPGKLVLPSVRVPVFDPATGKSRTATTEAITIDVTPGAAQAAVPGGAPPTQASG
ncbi:MAG: protein BatD, partial [Myxococcales bacterium]|nr:protein BatD [Myxococcales bacterium]